MRRLSGQDGGFLALELPIQPMNNIILAVLQPPQASDDTVVPLDLDFLRRHIAERLGDLPAFRWRVQRVPFGLNHPVFVDDQDFDLDDHLREFTLPSPGGQDQLDKFCASEAERRLDRRHPLWQITLVHGLAGGREAMVLKIHHCLMDGFATVTTLAHIFPGDGFLGDGYRALCDDPPWHPEAPPGRARLVVEALRDQGRTLRGLPAFVRKVKRSLALAKAEQSGPVVVPRWGVDAPPSLINKAFTVERGFARASLPIADIRLVAHAAGVRVNDVALAMVGGALRGYLAARGGLPDKPLLASVPVGLEAKGAPARTFGNRISGLTTTLGTDIADPWSRLMTVSAVTAESKRQLGESGPELLADGLDFVPPAIMERVVRHGDRARRKKPGKVDVNIVVSNVRGPHAPYSLPRSSGDSSGAVVVAEMYLTGPPNSGVGANVVLWDYGDRMLFGILAFADSVEAPGELAAGLGQALAELVLVAQARQAGGPDGVPA